MTADQIIDRILEQEGGFVDDPADRGGPTKYGITAETLGNWRGLTRPATRVEVQALTDDEARQIYHARYIVAPGFTPENIPHEKLRAALIDEGVNAGPTVAIKHLQAALGVSVDGVLGPVTAAAVRMHASADGLLLQVVRLRCLRYGRIVQQNPSQRRFIVGWLDRAFDMLI